MKITGQLVCGPNEKYLEKTCAEFARLCDDTVVALCNATPQERDIVEQFGFHAYEDNREWGREQPNIKTTLLQKIKERGTDWVVVLDADETLPTIDRATFEALTENRTSMQFYVINLWNDEGHYRKNSAFWNVRAYAPFASTDTQFLRKPLHCGNAPPFFYGSAKATYVPHVMLHRGLMNYVDRQRKAHRYDVYDPNARFKGREYYDMLREETGGSEYDEAAVLRKLQEFCAKL